MNRGLYIALAINTFLTFMAGILLTVLPDVLPNGVGVHIGAGEGPHFEGYMLGAAEWGLAAVSFFGRKITDVYALRVIALAFVVFHVCSATVELHTLATGGSDNLPGILGNIAVRLLLIAMFSYYGLYRNSRRVNSRRVPATSAGRS